MIVSLSGEGESIFIGRAREGFLPPPALQIRIGSARRQLHEPPEPADEGLPPRVAPEGDVRRFGRAACLRRQRISYPGNFMRRRRSWKRGSERRGSKEGSIRRYSKRPLCSCNALPNDLSALSSTTPCASEAGTGGEGHGLPPGFTPSGIRAARLMRDMRSGQRGSLTQVSMPKGWNDV